MGTCRPAVADACYETYPFLSAYPQPPLGPAYSQKGGTKLSALGSHTCAENRPPRVRAGQTNMCISHTNKLLQSTNQILLKILSSEKAMRIAVAEPAPPIMAMAISCTTHSADVSKLWLQQIKQSGRSERISTRTPIRTPPNGSRHDPLAMSAWSSNSKRKRFFPVSFWLELGQMWLCLYITLILGKDLLMYLASCDTAPIDPPP